MAAVREVVEALDEVRRAVAVLQEANFGCADDLIKAKADIASALQAAKVAGASEAELLEAAKPKAVEVENAGAAARKARKLRQLEKEVAEREKLEREKLERQKGEKDRLARLAEARAARKGQAKGDAAPAGAPEGDAAKGSAPPPAAAAELGQSAQATRREKWLAASSSASQPPPPRERSRSPARAAPSPPASMPPPAPVKAVDTGPAVPSLASMLGKPKPTPEEQAAEASGGSSKGFRSMADMPISMLMGGQQSLSSMAMGSGGRQLGNSDLSTGGGQICFRFAMGKCMSWNCNFKHAR